MQITFGAVLGLAVVALAIAAALATWLGMLGHTRGVLTAVVRATLQLAAVSLVIGAVIADPGVSRSDDRGGRTYRRTPARSRSSVVWALLPVLGTTPVLAGLAGTDVVPLRESC